jgi:hypothetical protein
MLAKFLLDPLGTFQPPHLTDRHPPEPTDHRAPVPLTPEELDPRERTGFVHEVIRSASVGGHLVAEPRVVAREQIRLIAAESCHVAR